MKLKSFLLFRRDREASVDDKKLAIGDGHIVNSVRVGLVEIIENLFKDEIDDVWVVIA
jgi:hypothetical protein